MPADFGGLPKRGSGRAARASWRSGSLPPKAAGRPVFWHLGDGVVWEREQSPVMPTPAPAEPSDVRSEAATTCSALLSADTLLGGHLLWRCADHGSGLVGGRAKAATSRSEGIWKTEWLAQPAERARHPPGALQVGFDWGAVDGVLHPSVRGPAGPLRAGWRSPDTSMIRKRRLPLDPDARGRVLVHRHLRRRGRLPRALRGDRRSARSTDPDSRRARRSLDGLVVLTGGRTAASV